MGKVKTVRLRTVTGVFFVCFIALMNADPFAAEPAGKTNTVSFEVLNPEAEMIMASDISIITPRIKDLLRKNIGLIWAGKSGGEFFLDALEVLLQKKYPSATISRYTRGVGDSEERILREVDTFVYAVGDSGQGAWDSISYTVKLERLGKPGVAVFGEHMMFNAQAP